MAPGRLIAGLGTGDSKSAAENLAFGIPFDPPDDAPGGAARLRAPTCSAAGIPVWVGGGSAATVELAVELDAGRQPVGGPALGGGGPASRAAR